MNDTMIQKLATKMNKYTIYFFCGDNDMGSSKLGTLYDEYACTLKVSRVCFLNKKDTLTLPNETKIDIIGVPTMILYNPISLKHHQLTGTNCLTFMQAIAKNVPKVDPETKSVYRFVVTGAPLEQQIQENIMKLEQMEKDKTTLGTPCKIQEIETETSNGFIFEE